VFGALNRVVPSHLMDNRLFDFAGLKATGVADEDGDMAFDAEDFDAPIAGFEHEDGGEAAHDAVLETKPAAAKRPVVFMTDLRAERKA